MIRALRIALQSSKVINYFIESDTTGALGANESSRPVNLISDRHMPSERPLLQGAGPWNYALQLAGPNEAYRLLRNDAHSPFSSLWRPGNITPVKRTRPQVLRYQPVAGRTHLHCATGMGFRVSKCPPGVILTQPACGPSGPLGSFSRPQSSTGARLEPRGPPRRAAHVPFPANQVSGGPRTPAFPDPESIAALLGIIGHRERQRRFSWGERGWTHGRRLATRFASLHGGRVAHKPITPHAAAMLAQPPARHRTFRQRCLSTRRRRVFSGARRGPERGAPATECVRIRARRRCADNEPISGTARRPRGRGRPRPEQAVHQAFEGVGERKEILAVKSIDGIRGASRQRLLHLGPGHLYRGWP